jgi:hypothetical protein
MYAFAKNHFPYLEKKIYDKADNDFKIRKYISYEDYFNYLENNDNDIYLENLINKEDSNFSEKIENKKQLISKINEILSLDDA